MKKKDILYLHIGTHKTGSSSIQSAIRKNNKKLKSEGISDLGRPPNFRSFSKATNIDNSLILNDTKIIKKRITRERLLGRSRFLISTEAFSGDHRIGYKNSAIVAESLFQMIDDFDVNTKIIIYLRRQDEFIESLYTQLIHEGGDIQFKKYIENIDHEWFNWKRLVDSYSTFFGKENIIVRVYSKKCLPTRNSLFQSFGEIINSKAITNFQPSQMSNQGYSRDALEIARMVNSQLNGTERKQIRKLLQRVSFKKPFERFGFFDFVQRSQFLKKYEESNNQIAERYFNRSSLFELPSKKSSMLAYEGLTNETLTTEITKLILDLDIRIRAQNKSSKIQFNKLWSKIGSTFPRLKSKIKLLAGRY